MSSPTNPSYSISDNTHHPTIDFNNPIPIENESKSESSRMTSNQDPQVVNDDRNKSSTLTTNPQRTFNDNVGRENQYRGLAIASHLVNGTVTIVLERCKPLILKLRNPQYSIFGFGTATKPEGDIEQIIGELGTELIEHVTDAVDTIRNETKRARPQPEEDNYELKMKAYQELLNYITQMMNGLTKMVTESLTEYHRLIDQLWNDLQRSQNDNEAQNYIQQFLQLSEQNFRDAIKNNIEPLLEAVEAKLNLLK